MCLVEEVDPAAAAAAETAASRTAASRSLSVASSSGMAAWVFVHQQPSFTHEFLD